MKKTALIYMTLFAILLAPASSITAAAQSATATPTSAATATPKPGSAFPRAYPFQANDHYRFYTQTGQIASDAQYRRVVSLSDPADPNDDSGYIDQITLPDASPPSDAPTIAWRFIQKDGTPRAETYAFIDRDPRLSFVSGGLARFLTGSRDGKIYIIDPVTGAEISPGFDSVQPLDTTLTRFLVQETWESEPRAIWDRNAGIIARFPEGTTALDLKGGEYVLCVSQAGPADSPYIYALADPHTGARRTDTLYQTLSRGDPTGSRIVAQNLAGKFGAVDAHGGIVIAFEYDSIESAYGDLYIVTQDAREGLLDAQGREILPLESGNVSVYGDFILKGGKTQRLYDREGKLLATVPGSDSIQMVYTLNPQQQTTPRYAMLRQDDVLRYMDAQGNDIPAFDGLYVVDELRPGVVLVQAAEDGSKMGLRTAAGKWLVPAEYSYIHFYGDVPQPYYAATILNRRVYFDLDGNRIVPNPRYTARIAGEVYTAEFGAAYGLADAAGNWIVKRSRYDQLMD